ncbi:hypothetical protein QC762_0068500 [Podospora pseudocomata]|uniref:Uncharacterized protein n=2 Tax=Podospora TaxID=5144 RepID=A0ABR0GG36_9PEZI|nr:hypothetical protein QC761_0068180 [Podospora bellae-mahoneyi]KAK4654719.1 hypothetical protein QC762_0068500 [Podospora pseudocomata]
MGGHAGNVVRYLTNY